MLCILVLFTAILRRPWIAITAVNMIIMIVTYIHISKFELRGTPLLPEDFQLASEAASLTKFVNWGSIVRLIVAIGISWGLGLLLEKLTWDFFGFKKRWQTDLEKAWLRRGETKLRFALAAIAILGFVAGTDFVRHHNGQRYEEIWWLNTELVAWNQVRNYDYNGFILGFLYNWSKFELSAPNGYSEEKIEEVAAEYTAKKASDTERASLQDADYNIVIVLNESFYDPEIIKEYYNYGEADVTPELHKIMAENPSGQMYSTDYGGGTANIEFEVLTGLTNYWANTVPYTDLLPKTGAIPSLASFAKENGYQTTAIHPFNGGMYKRNIALAAEGFDKFITETEMGFTEHEGTGGNQSQYINDQSAYRQVLKELGEADEKEMVLLITMQNHTPYDEDIYEQLDFRIPEYEEEDWWREWRVATYLQLLHQSDKYLGEFIEELEKSEEKTVVLFFGDHSPGIFDKVSENEEKEVRDLARLTPYFVYANFELEDSTTEGSATDGGLPTTTPNCLGNTMFNLLGTTKPTLGYLLDEVCAEAPILTANYWGEEAPFQSTVLSNYELVNYDILGGTKIWAKAAD